MIKFRIFPARLRFGPAVAVAISLQLFMSLPVFAASVEASLSLDDNLVYCSAAYRGNGKRISGALSEGTEVTLVWKLNVLGIREYWLNKGIGGVVVKRRVVPDLVSRTWELIDQTSGITYRVGNLAVAVAFLSNLRRFPVMDRALLEQGQKYHLSLTIEEHLGVVDYNWFTRWWGYEKTKSGLDFTNR